MFVISINVCGSYRFLQTLHFLFSVATQKKMVMIAAVSVKRFQKNSAQNDVTLESADRVSCGLWKAEQAPQHILRLLPLLRKHFADVFAAQREWEGN
jgi:hypothetical protein